MKSARWLGILIAAVVCRAASPTWDNSGNGMLNGSYYFREVVYALSSEYADGTLEDAEVLYGGITFSGGSYSTKPTGCDLYEGTCGSSSTAVTGAYSIAASGYGFLVDPATGAYIYGTVGQNGIFIGSLTGTGYNGLLIAAPLASPAPTVSSFNGSYTFAGVDLSGGAESPAYNVDYLMNLSPNGAGKLGSPTVKAYAGGNGSTPITQTLGSTTYTFSSGAAVVTFPNSNSAAVYGQKYLYFSPDGNFVFGGGPEEFDMLVGVKTGSSAPNFSGLYGQAGLDQNDTELISSGYGLLDTYYGSLNAAGGTTIEHQQVLSPLVSGTAYASTFSDSYSVASNGTYSDGIMNYVVGASGVRIGSGIGPYLGLNVAVPVATVNPTGSVFLNPMGVVSAGSFAPFTAPLVPGELITLYGSNLAPDPFTVASAAPFPTTMDGVQVLVNNQAAPIYYTTPTQISAIVPYEATTPVVQIQVVNPAGSSNVVTNLSATTAPGILTQTESGQGYGDAVHVAGPLAGQLVTPQNPAQIGETVAVFLTGLGAVYPAITDGAAGPSNPLSQTVATVNAYLDATTTANSVEAAVPFEGLAPTLAGLYQMNVTIPSGTTAGDNYLEITGPDSDSLVALISVGSGTSSSARPAMRPAALGRRANPVPEIHGGPLRLPWTR